MQVLYLSPQAGPSREKLRFATNTWYDRASCTYRVAGLRSFSHKFDRVHLSPLAGRGRIAMAMRSIASAIRVRGRRRMGGAGDKKVMDALNHRCRIVFLGAPESELRSSRSPGARAFRARTIAEASLRRPSPRERPHRANIFPGQSCTARAGKGSDAAAVAFPYATALRASGRV